MQQMWFHITHTHAHRYVRQTFFLFLALIYTLCCIALLVPQWKLEMVLKGIEYHLNSSSRYVLWFWPSKRSQIFKFKIGKSHWIRCNFLHRYSLSILKVIDFLVIYHRSNLMIWSFSISSWSCDGRRFLDSKLLPLMHILLYCAVSIILKTWCL